MSFVSWEPHTVVTDEVVEHAPVAALAALLDDGLAAPGVGDELPPLWHWVALARWPVSAEIGVDGHPRRGSFLPPIDLPRRMFAGGSASFHAGITVGSTVRRESRVTSVEEKSGRSGNLVLVEVRTRLFNEDGACAVDETQDLVFREGGAAGDDAATPDSASGLIPAGSPLHRHAAWEWELATDPTLLMRFSAATSNPHRIHYDWPYATRVEGYPGLVVHGPLMTLALAELVRLEDHPWPVTHIRHRVLRPLYCGQRASLVRTGSQESGGMTLSAVGPDSTEGAEPRPNATVTVGSSTR
ncbi:MaoC family dehydratase N-terminal domain-containing protein [Haloechinothrix sp. YIM 98757]|uniref:MaoC family dehydratase N-terminal domain-containing protein n=1 Tax=Haloechinothrix aidingensis TaxID=2752311 RepID=A0A838AC29_9PSEU|nr:MaoC family dehydratase N-terminal domain-containing protein [Haloechinothrix aidingensis]